MYTLKYQEFSEALYQALQPDPFYIRLLQSIPGDKEKQEALISYLDYSMYEAEKYGLLFIPGQHRYGASVWSKPLSTALESEKGQEKKMFLKANLGDGVLDAYVQMVDFMSTKVDGLIPADAWYLSIVGIKPEFQGKGLGVGLINEILEKTDKLGLSTYLETFTPRNISFYNRLGYEESASFLEPVTNATYWVMQREARG
ncbi:GNAT family N-acetyltransferase [Mucilaginibacter ginsenosidivorax]|uniref:GNAT family N-acetyltransferase n=1 Tax=Mucilaginibacter ginsenosidivorax TaxID=862126 RepID=A0A5B8VS32_9SPHI|nr:GNAT family N-acetyltransferase [Mucilaginibacter ginsenosidivorax]QEC74444.1 GNAT family N-acetyltransferase [Mucilaginibacter ginsenosidivorax]